MRRYKNIHGIVSQLDPIKDTLCLLEYLTAREYLENLLKKTWGLSSAEAKKRSQKIIPHINYALNYIKLSLEGSEELSFLPAYYGLLNLIKVYILFGPYSEDLAKHKWHGASYSVNEKDSRSLVTENINLKKNGAIPLFYKTITNKELPAPKKIKLSEILPYVSSVTAEYYFATGQHSKILHFEYKSRQHPKRKNYHIATVNLLRHPKDKTNYAPSDFKLFMKFKKDPSNPDVFVGKIFPRNTEISNDDFMGQFRPFLVYGIDGYKFTTPCCSQNLLLPEELPIILLFFYMSSIVRYKPEFLQKVRNSKYWPLLSAARQHCILRMLNLSWSFFHQQSLVIKHE